MFCYFSRQKRAVERAEREATVQDKAVRVLPAPSTVQLGHVSTSPHRPIRSCVNITLFRSCVNITLFCFVNMIDITIVEELCLCGRVFYYFVLLPLLLNGFMIYRYVVVIFGFCLIDFFYCLVNDQLVILSTRAQISIAKISNEYENITVNFIFFHGKD